MVDAEKIKDDRRLPFGLPGVNKGKKVSNGNYLWISYFHSYLSPKGRAGFVMSSQASSAGHGEREVRRKIVQTGDVDIMVAIRSNFFYTRTVPCELWFFDKGKPSPPLPSPPAPLPKGEGSKHYRGGYDFSGLVERARELREKQTPAEDVLWQLLRNRQLAGLKFRRQHQIGDYITDFYCDEIKLVIELDGAIHGTARQSKRDEAKQRYLESLGLIILRFDNQSALDSPQTIFEAIISYLPSPNGRGVGGEGKSCAPHGPLNAKGNILMLDARNIFRKVTRKIYDFSPEQLKNLTAIVWLYRGENKRFAALLEEYRETCREKRREVQTTVPDAIKEAWSLGSAIKGCGTPLSPEFQKLISEMDMECKALDGQILQRDYTKDADALPDLAKTCKAWVHRLREFRRVATPLVADAGQNAETPEAKKELKRQWNQTGESIDTAEAALEANIYFTRHLEWLLHRFPDGTYRDVPGLVKLVTLAEIEAADWSLTPGRYVGVAAAEEDDEENFEEEMRAIHAELGDLNAEAIELAEKIQANFEELGI
jgi:very-short-patch-repair endonuclease/type I restriction-modification system DNA methylase subunit